MDNPALDQAVGTTKSIPPLNLNETVRLVAVFNKIATKLKISESDLERHMKEHEGEHILVIIMGIIKEIINHAFGDYDFDTETPGEVMMMVVTTLSRILGKTEDEIRLSDAEEVLGWVEEVIATERDRRLGRLLGRMIRPVTSMISRGIAIVKLKAEMAVNQFASSGGPDSGGTTGFSSDLEESLESFPQNSESLGSEKPSPSLEG